MGSLSLPHPPTQCNFTNVSSAFQKAVSDCKVLSFFVGYTPCRDVTVLLLPNNFFFFFFSKEVKLPPVYLFRFLCCLQAGASLKTKCHPGQFLLTDVSHFPGMILVSAAIRLTILYAVESH